MSSLGDPSRHESEAMGHESRKRMFLTNFNQVLQNGIDVATLRSCPAHAVLIALNKKIPHLVSSSSKTNLRPIQHGRMCYIKGKPTSMHTILAGCCWVFHFIHCML